MQCLLHRYDECCTGRMSGDIDTIIAYIDKLDGDIDRMSAASVR